MIKVMNYALAVVAMTLAIFLLVLKGNVAMSKGNVMLEVYSRYNFDVFQINMQTSGVLSKNNFNKEEISMLIENVKEKLDIENILVEDEKNNGDFIDSDEFINNCDFTNLNSCKLVKDAKNAKIEISLSRTMLDKINMSMRIILYQNEKAILYLQEKLKDIYKMYDVNPEINITVIGTYDEDFTLEDKKRTVKRIMACLKGEIKEEYENERLYSIYGYTNLIDDYENVKGSNVNIHIAMRYNEYEGKTYLYIASPIISTDY